MTTTNAWQAGSPSLARFCGRRLLYAGAGFGVTILLFSVGLVLGRAGGETPAIAPRKTVLITDAAVREEEEEIFEMTLELELQIPHVEIDMNPVQDMVPPPFDLDIAVNARLDFDITVPAPPVPEAVGKNTIVAPVAVDAPVSPAVDVGNTVFSTFQLETPPRLIHAAPPNYPRQARRSGLQGVVRVTVVLDKQGGIVSTRLVPGPNVDVFGDATLEAVKKWRFEPGKIGNRPVMCEVDIPVEFNLGSGGGGGRRR